MKKILILFLLITNYCFSQNSGITYQAVVYNPNGEELPGVDNPYAPLTNRNICLQFGIIDNTGTVEYQEQVQVTTDNFGMVNLLIGTSTQTGGYSSGFNGIVWSADAKFLKVDLDIKGNCSNFEELSNQPFTYVPFAYYSPASDIPGPQGPQGETGAQGETGPQGEAGAVGAQGPQGVQGIQGSAGPQGSPGPQGIPGAPGDDGQQGVKSLINTTEESAGPNCDTGGTRIEVGIDTNNNNILDPDEIDTSLTRYICNGEVAIKTLINSTAEEPGDNCTNGGVKIEVGEDANFNGVLETDEINDSLTRYVCNGNDGVDGQDGQDGVNSVGTSSTIAQELFNYITKHSLSLDGNTLSISQNIYDGVFDCKTKVYDISNNGFSKIGQTISYNVTYFNKLNSDGTKLLVYPDIGTSNATVDIYKLESNNWVLENQIEDIVINGQRTIFQISDDFNTIVNKDGKIYELQANQYTNTYDIGAFNIYFDYNLDINSDGTVVVFGSSNTNPTIGGDGIISVYNKINNTWVEMGERLFYGDSTQNQVKISSDGLSFATVRPSYDDFQLLAVKVFYYDNNEWIQKGNDIFVDDVLAPVIEFSGNYLSLLKKEDLNDGSFLSYITAYNFNQNLNFSYSTYFEGDLFSSSHSFRDPFFSEESGKLIYFKPLGNNGKSLLTIDYID